MSRYARRTDRNHAEIRDGLRKAGYKVWDTSRLGGGFPDLQVWNGTRLVLLEVKMPGEKLTPDEDLFHQLFPVRVVYSLDDAVEAVHGSSK